MPFAGSKDLWERIRPVPPLGCDVVIELVVEVTVGDSGILGVALATLNMSNQQQQSIAVPIIRKALDNKLHYPYVTSSYAFIDMIIPPDVTVSVKYLYDNGEDVIMQNFNIFSDDYKKMSSFGLYEHVVIDKKIIYTIIAKTKDYKYVL